MELEEVREELEEAWGECEEAEAGLEDARAVAAWVEAEYDLTWEDYLADHRGGGGHWGYYDGEY